MFTTKHVACWLEGFSGAGADTENKELKLLWHINPITPTLASEISPGLADRLYRNIVGEIMPAREISKAVFASAIPMQNVTFHSLPSPPKKDKGVTVPSCAISNLRAARSGADFRLEFEMIIPMDRDTMELVQRYYKSTCFLSMEEVQMSLDEKPPEEKQDEETQLALQDAADGAGKGDEVPPPDKRPKRDRRSASAGSEA